MNLTIIDGEPRGHYLILYFRVILRESLTRGWKVHLVTTQRALDDPVFANLRNEYGDHFTVSLMKDIRNSETLPNWRKIVQHFQRWFAMRDGIKESRKQFEPDLVYQVGLEKCDLPMAVLGTPFGDRPYAGHLINRYFHGHEMKLISEPLSRRDKLMAWAYRKLLRQKMLRRIFNIDPTLTEYPHRMGWHGADKAIFIPDTCPYNPFSDLPNPRGYFGLPEDKFVLANYGSLTPRKGVREMIEALDHPDCPRDVIGLLAGRTDAGATPDVQSDLAKKLVAEKRLYIFDRFLSDEEECAVFLACDLAWICYKKFYGMSSVLLHSGSAAKPVLTSDQGLTNHFVTNRNLGYVASIYDTAAIAKVLADAHGDPSARIEKGRNNSVFASEHGSDVFGRLVCDELAKVAGKS